MAFPVPLLKHFLTPISLLHTTYLLVYFLYNSKAMRAGFFLLSILSQHLEKHIIGDL